MKNQNILIGIDLGTTNSEIAINANGKVQIIKNSFGDEYTPSVFGFDKSKNEVVGKRAYERLYKDASKEEFKNNKAEIKRLMGTEETIFFERAKAKMTPEKISGEILKSLKEDLLRKHADFNTDAVVITVPAAFSTLQSEATKRAGNLAGFKHVVLLQEPIAAAVAYGFGNTKNENWLIFDFGGGTFDVALIASKNGVLSVLGHNGDNFLGGKNIDYLILDEVIVPELIEEFSLANFNRSNEKYQSVFSKLKYISENAKIALSQYEKTTIEVDGIGSDDDGKEIYLSINYTRKEFEKLIQPLIDKTIGLSIETLKEAGIKSNSVKKIILVGGPTQIPYVKKRLETDLDISVDSSVDPLTVVAQGACIFGMGQLIPVELTENKKMKKGVQPIKLNHGSLTSETEEMVTGILEGLEDGEDSYFIQIQSDSGVYSGQKKKIKNGKFFDTVVLEPNKTNLYWIYLFDVDGNSVPIEPDSFEITHGLTVSGAPLPHSIGIVLAQKDLKNNFKLSNVREIIFEKGSALPLKHSGSYKTVRKLKKNDDENPLKIRIDEGESKIPDRNTFVCELGISGSDLPYDLPEKTEVEITIELNESRELNVTSYISLIDLTINARSTVRDEIVDVEILETELNTQTEKAISISSTCTPEEKTSIENTIAAVRKSVKNAYVDEDEKRKASKQIKDLKIALDKVEEEKKMPQLVKEFRESIVEVTKMVQEIVPQKDIKENIELLSKIEEEGEKAIKEDDKILLIRVNEQIRELGMKAYLSNPLAWVYKFKELVKNTNYTNEKEAKYYIDKGIKAIDKEDMEELKRCVVNLLNLLPPDEQETIQNLSGITR